MSNLTVSQISNALGKSDKILRTAVDEVSAIAKKASGILADRDRIDSAIISTADGISKAAVSRDQSKLSDLSVTLEQQLSNRAAMTRAYEETLSRTDRILEPISQVANSALAVVPALKAISDHLTELPQPIVAALYSGTSKINFSK